MIQAGLHKITLYENNSLHINYDSFEITSSGDIIELSENPKILIDPQAVNINYRIEARIDGFSNEITEKINNSTYGWIAKLDFFNLETKVIEKPFIRPQANDLNNNISNSRIIELEAWNRQGLIPFS